MRSAARRSASCQPPRACARHRIHEHPLIPTNWTTLLRCRQLIRTCVLCRWRFSVVDSMSAEFSFKIGFSFHTSIATLFSDFPFFQSHQAET
jgi:hypothetical protein